MNEEEIIIELKKHNKQVFAQLVDQYKNRIFSMAYKYTNDYNEAQDLAQEVFLKIYKQINTFKGDSKLSTWIYRVCVNTCLDWRRKHSKTSVTSYDALMDFNQDPCQKKSDYSLDIPEEKVLHLEKHRELHNEIYKMKDIYKNVIIMYHFNEMSYEEISKSLDIPIKTIETRLYRARKKLRNQLKSHDMEAIESGV